MELVRFRASEASGEAVREDAGIKSVFSMISCLGNELRQVFEKGGEEHAHR